MKDALPTSEAPPAPGQIIEALLFVGGAPLSASRACEIVRSLTPELFQELMDQLNREYRRQRRPYVIQSSPDGFTLILKPQFDGVRERLASSPREARLTAAALDVLALIAFQQPITRADIDSQRGADSRGPLHQLTRLGLIFLRQREQTDQDAGYVTSPRFLELFGLTGLGDLPRIGELQRL